MLPCKYNRHLVVCKAENGVGMTVIAKKPRANVCMTRNSVKAQTSFELAISARALSPNANHDEA
jgi:hypothetical protein